MRRGKVAIIGADGFIGRNLAVRLDECGYTVLPITRASSKADWDRAVSVAEAVFHLAAANRPPQESDFQRVNVGTAEYLIKCLEECGSKALICYSSSIRVTADDPYGRSKKEAEERLNAFGKRAGVDVYTFRLPNVFGKWARPNYNSVVATFCHNVARKMPITVNDSGSQLDLVYIDDVVCAFIDVLEGRKRPGLCEVDPVYSTSVGEIADIIRGFRADRAENLIDQVGFGLRRALYATYVSALPCDEFSYTIESHGDPRGSFAEVLKTRASGQFSYFTALPGVTRGGHYHHSKTEKFLIVQGKARFRFRHIITGDYYELETSGAEPRIVETVPGWSHDVTNIGEGTMISLLWANEIFDRTRPDTIGAAFQ